MREWRRWYSNTTDSESLSLVSDGAYCLFAMLVARQDDAGYYPWSPAKVRSLTATRSWGVEQTEGFLEELISIGIIEKQDNSAFLIKGEELNGQPRSDRRRLVYKGNGTPLLGKKEQPKKLPVKATEVPTDAEPHENPFGQILHSIPKWPSDREATHRHLSELTIDFPMTDMEQELKKFRDWHKSHPLPAKANPYLRLRNWLLKASKNQESVPGSGMDNVRVD